MKPVFVGALLVIGVVCLACFAAAGGGGKVGKGGASGAPKGMPIDKAFVDKVKSTNLEQNELLKQYAKKSDKTTLYVASQALLSCCAKCTAEQTPCNGKCVAKATCKSINPGCACSAEDVKFFTDQKASLEKFVLRMGPKDTEEAKIHSKAPEQKAKGGPKKPTFLEEQDDFLPGLKGPSPYSSYNMSMSAEAAARLKPMTTGLTQEDEQAAAHAHRDWQHFVRTQHDLNRGDFKSTLPEDTSHIPQEWLDRADRGGAIPMHITHPAYTEFLQELLSDSAKEENERHAKRRERMKRAAKRAGASSQGVMLEVHAGRAYGDKYNDHILWKADLLHREDVTKTKFTHKNEYKLVFHEDAAGKRVMSLACTQCIEYLVKGELLEQMRAKELLIGGVPGRFKAYRKYHNIETVEAGLQGSLLEVFFTSNDNTIKQHVYLGVPFDASSNFEANAKKAAGIAGAIANAMYATFWTSDETTAVPSAPAVDATEDPNPEAVSNGQYKTGWAPSGIFQFAWEFEGSLLMSEDVSAGGPTNWNFAHFYKPKGVDSSHWKALTLTERQKIIKCYLRVGKEPEAKKDDVMWRKGDATCVSALSTITNHDKITPHFEDSGKPIDFEHWVLCGAGECMHSSFSLPSACTAAGIAGTWTEKLVQEVSANTWEIIHRFKEDKIEDAFSQTKCFQLLLPQASSHHLHVSLPAPKSIVTAKVVVAYLLMMGDFIEHGDALAYLRHPYFGVASKADVTKLFAQLEHGYMQVEHEYEPGHNWGRFKKAAVGIRHHKYGYGRFGFEARVGTGFWLDILRYRAENSENSKLGPCDSKSYFNDNGAYFEPQMTRDFGDLGAYVAEKVPNRVDLFKAWLIKIVTQLGQKSLNVKSPARFWGDAKAINNFGRIFHFVKDKRKGTTDFKDDNLFSSPQDTKLMSCANKEGFGSPRDTEAPLSNVMKLTNFIGTPWWEFVTPASFDDTDIKAAHATAKTDLVKLYSEESTDDQGKFTCTASKAEAQRACSATKTIGKACWNPFRGYFKHW